MGENKEVAILKREAIRKANQTMFFAVAGAALVFGATVVGMSYLIRVYMFNAKVLGEQNKSIETIKTNIENINTLKKELSAIEADENLANTPKSNADNSPLRAIADALPADENASALGASVNQYLFNEGILVESFNIDSVETVDETTGTSDATAVVSARSAEASNPSANAIPTDAKAIQFSATLTAKFASENATPAEIEQSKKAALTHLVNALKKSEKSIRAINVGTFKFEASSNALTLTLTAKAYYYPEYQMKLDTKKVKSDDSAKASSSNSSSTTGGTK